VSAPSVPASPHRLSADQFATSFRTLGIGAGDIVMVHACLDAVEPAVADAMRAERARSLLDALRSVVGEGGTILVPTYTFSFCRGEVFDVERTPTQGGPWSDSAEFLELVRRSPGAVRSRDPIHSVAGIGPQAADLLLGARATCFGPGSVFERLRLAGAKICVIGAPLDEATIRHHAEELAGVPFRYRKLFTGEIRDGAGAHREGWLYSVRLRADNGYPDAAALERLARDQGICRVAPVGAGEMLLVEAGPWHDLVTAELRRNPWATARGPAGDAEALDDAATDAPGHRAELPAGASMRQMIDALWRLPRDIVSPGYDAALRALATQAPMTIHEFPTGLECWSWIVPEKWTCHEAYLETLDGERLVDVADHPLHVVSYSLPFEGEVSRETLLEHLHVHPVLPDAVPWQFKYYERDWGLCCTRTLKESLRDDRYRVVIRTSFSYGTLKVGEIVAPGRTDETIVLCAHLCHPAQANDDLSGVAVGMDVMRALLARRDLRYTYRLLILPETIGSVAYLSHNEGLIPKMRGGLFLEMLGLPNAHSLMLSHDARTEVDECFSLALKEHDPSGWTTPFRSSIGNDERMFNAPGVRVPMLSLSRVLPLDAEHWPYPEYHSSADTPALVSAERLADSRDLVLRMIDTLEGNTRPVNRFKGEVFCSRYGLHVDWYTNPEGNRALFDIMNRIDGTSSVVDIARACGVSFRAARMTVDELRRHDLVDDEAGAAALAPSAGRGR